MHIFSVNYYTLKEKTIVEKIKMTINNLNMRRQHIIYQTQFQQNWIVYLSKSKQTKWNACWDLIGTQDRIILTWNLMTNQVCRWKYVFILKVCTLQNVQCAMCMSKYIVCSQYVLHFTLSFLKKIRTLYCIYKRSNLRWKIVFLV